MKGELFEIMSTEISRSMYARLMNAVIWRIDILAGCLTIAVYSAVGTVSRKNGNVAPYSANDSST